VGRTQYLVECEIHAADSVSSEVVDFLRVFCDEYGSFHEMVDGYRFRVDGGG